MGQNNFSEATELIKKQLESGPSSVYEPIVKHNENHDEKGKFSSGSGTKQQRVLQDVRDMQGAGHSPNEINAHLSKVHGLNAAQGNFAQHVSNHPEIFGNKN